MALRKGAPEPGLADAGRGAYDFDVLEQSHLGPRHAAPARRNRWRTVVSTLLFVVALGLFAVAGWQWWDSQQQYAAQEQINQKLSGYAKVPSDPSQPPEVDWAGLKAVNPDVVAWLQIPGTLVNYPVYQGETNDTYLRTNAEGNYTVGGQVFMDCENTGPDLQDQQTLVYGHHLKDGSMFAQVATYDDQDFFDTASTLWWVTEQGAYEMTPVFCFHVTPDDETVRQFVWETPEGFQEYLQSKLALAVTSRADAAEVLPNLDRVLTLSTCNYIDGKGRTVVVFAPKAALEATGAAQ